MNKFLEFIMISGIAILLFLIFMLFKAQKKELHFKLLTLFFMILLNYLIIGYADINEFNILILIAFPVVDNVEFLLGPIILLYVEALFNHKKTIQKKDYLHFLPALVYLLFFTIPTIFFFFTDTYPFAYLHKRDEYEDILYILLICYLIAYISFAKLKYNQYLKVYKNLFATSSIENVSWVNKMLLGILFVCSIDFFVGFYSFFIPNNYDSFYITMIVSVVLIIYLGYYGTNQAKILLPEGIIEFKPKNKNLKPTETIALKQQLILLFDKEKIHQDENLNLQKLADTMHINHKKLSYLLNNHLHTNFYELINKKRIDDVKQKMEDPAYQHHNIIEIAYEAGFQSKASFNRIFKKETNTSPTEYKKRLAKEIV